MLILVINCGSSSAKYRLFNVEGEKSLARGVVERIGHADSNLIYEKNGHSFLPRKVICHDHHA
ncbi:MAG: acetate kinase, partial [Candidatus Omnitrophota bacterium]|nr:acetate kinase [Candidatus Omnitrophota bacterium]